MIDCKANIQKRKDKLRQYIVEHNLSDCFLAIIQVGNNPASNSYIKGKIKDCEEIGFNYKHYKYDENIDTITICDIIKSLNTTNSCMGIIVQLPLPDHLDENLILNTISDSKDVDGFKSTSPFKPCTPLGIFSILEDINYDVKGKVVTVVGKGKTVGRPLVNMLMDKGATVVSCNSKTPYHDLCKLARISDVVITCVGKINLISELVFWNDDELKFEFPDVIIDVGINRGEDGKLYGDCNKELYGFVDNITPVPGGVGLYTRISLLENTIYKGENNIFVD